MAIIHKTINGHGPYAYRVTYSNGSHEWEYLGPVDDNGGDNSNENNINDTSEENSDDVDYSEMPTPKLLELHEMYSRDHEQAVDALDNLGRLEAEDSYMDDVAERSMDALHGIALVLADRDVNIPEKKKELGIGEDEE